MLTERSDINVQVFATRRDRPVRDFAQGNNDGRCLVDTSLEDRVIAFARGLATLSKAQSTNSTKFHVPVRKAPAESIPSDLQTNRFTYPVIFPGSCRGVTYNFLNLFSCKALPTR